MDGLASVIARHVHAVSSDALDAAVVGHCKARLIDTIGLGLAALESPAAGIAGALYKRASMTTIAGGRSRLSSVLGARERTLPELAGLSNGLLTRYLDGNDVFPGGGTPSDMIAPLLAVAQDASATGRDAIAAIVTGYEIYHRLFASLPLRARGFDHSTYTAVASAAGSARLLGLSPKATEHALSIALAANLSLGVTRRGVLSMWKGAAGALAGHNGILAALLADQGMTGPDRVVEGEFGLAEVVGTLDPDPWTFDGRVDHICRSNLKYLLAEYHAQGPILAALELRARLDVEAIASVEIDTYEFAWKEIGSEPEKWHPQTRETADHSLPYMVAGSLVDGHFSDALFSTQRMADPRILALASRITVRSDRGFTERFPEALPCRVTIRTHSGSTHTAGSDHPKGHWRNPMTADELESKFRSLAERVLSSSAARRLLETLQTLDAAPSVEPLFEHAVRDR